MIESTWKDTLHCFPNTIIQISDISYFWSRNLQFLIIEIIISQSGAHILSQLLLDCTVCKIRINTIQALHIFSVSLFADFDAYIDWSLSKTSTLDITRSARAASMCTRRGNWLLGRGWNQFIITSGWEMPPYEAHILSFAVVIVC